MNQASISALQYHIGLYQAFTVLYLQIFIKTAVKSHMACSRGR